MARKNNDGYLKTALKPMVAVASMPRLRCLLALLTPGLAFAAPTGGEVVGGGATISTPDTRHTVIDQSTQNAIVNWQQFNVGASEYVIFNQPNASAAILNRIIGGNPSEILGNITANGRVFLINPQGILFGEGARIDVGGLVASTLNINNADFMAGRYVLAGNSTAAIVNRGTISAGASGFVVLAGDSVSNAGLIQAQLGKVVLASGSAMTLDLNGDGLVNFRIDEAALSEQAGVSNLGEIAAQGGMVAMTAKTAGELARTTVNNSGLIKAQGITVKGGSIYLTASGGSVTNSGTLDASGKNGNDGGRAIVQAGGDIRHSGTINVAGKNGGTARLIADKHLTTAAGSVIDARADDSTSGKGGFVELSGHQSFQLGGQTLIGKGGTLLLDPTTLTITGGSGSALPDVVYEDDIESQLNSDTNVIIAATDDIFANGTFTGGINSTGVGNLLIGIGAVDAPVSNTLPDSAETFIRGDGTVGHGNIDLLLGGNPSDPLTFNLGGGLRIIGGRQYGDVAVGGITATDVLIDAAGTLTTGDITADNTVDLTGGQINLANVSIGGPTGVGAPIPDVTLTGDITLTRVSISAHTLTLDSPDDISIHGSSLTATGDLEITAHNNLWIDPTFDTSYSTYSGYLYGSSNFDQRSELSGNHITLVAETGDIGIFGSDIHATGDLDIAAHNDLAIGSSFDQYGHFSNGYFYSKQYNPQNSDLSGDTITLTSESADINISGATVHATGDLEITAHNNLAIGSAFSHSSTFGYYYYSEGSEVVVNQSPTTSNTYGLQASHLSSGGKITLAAETGDLSIFGATVSATGDLDVTAHNNLIVGSSFEHSYSNQSGYIDGGNTNPQTSELDGAHITLVATTGDVSIFGTAVSATGDLDVTAHNNLLIDSSYNSTYTSGNSYTRFYDPQYSDLSSGGKITLTAETGNLGIYGSMVSATGDLDITAQNHLTVASSYSQDNGYSYLGQYSKLQASNITLAAITGDIRIAGATLNAIDAEDVPGELKITAGHNLNITGSAYYYDGYYALPSDLRGSKITLTAETGAVSIHGSSVSASGNLEISAGKGLAINSFYYGDGYYLYSSLAGDKITLTASDGDVKIDNTAITADTTLQIFASADASNVIPTNNLIGGSLLSTEYYVPRGDINVHDSRITVGGIEVVSDTGAVDFTDSTVTVGTVGVPTSSIGYDPDLIASLIEQEEQSLQADPNAANTLPLNLSSTPNAVFVGKNGVNFGHLIMQGSYLYVEAPTVDGANFGGSNLKIAGNLDYVGVQGVTDPATDPLLYNAVPYGDAGAIVLYAEQINQLAPDYEITLALGSSAFSDSITVSTDTVPLDNTNITTPLGIALPYVDPPFNFVFKTKGTVTGTQNITIPGKVAVLKSVVITKPSDTNQKLVEEIKKVTSTNNNLFEDLIKDAPLKTQQKNLNEKKEKKKEHTNMQDPDAPDNSREVIRVKDSKPLDAGKSCT